MITIDYYNRTNAPIAQALFLTVLGNAWIELVSQKIVRKNAEYYLELTLIGDKEMIELNAVHHKKQHSTDVISLSYFDGPQDNDDFAGEIFVSLPYARRQAVKIGQSLEEELRFLFTHGLLHVFGFDHKKPDEEEAMLELTYKILERQLKSGN